MNYIGELPMKPEIKSQTLLNITRAKAKMWEYDVPLEHHINISDSPEKLFTLSIALLGDVAAEINRGHENTDTFKILKENLQFSADFFHAFDEAKLVETLSPRLRLLASSAFYLCNMPGSAGVLAKLVKYEDLSVEAEGLEALLLWILQGDTSTSWNEYTGNYADFMINLPIEISNFYNDGNARRIEERILELREKVYNWGTPEQLLLGDIISAVMKKKIINASIRLLPEYSDIPMEVWTLALSKPNFIKELWPAQHLLGEKEVFKGKSAVIQMPTSAGKTKSTELILRSAFLAQRTNLAVIVAPFRALCNEIKNDLLAAFQDEDINIDTFSDVLQNDFEIDFFLGILSKPNILVVTPEKLLYVLRHNPEITTNLKLVIFDEGHQFDTGKRGVTYELLLTSLKEFLPDNAQKILISAVIPNAEEIGEWLNGDKTVAKGEHLSPTFKSIGFASWRDSLGRIQYNEGGIDTYFVPRVIEKQNLQLQGRERKVRVFPENTGQDIALFLGIKLSINGGVAIFCGRKDTAINICKRVVEITNRNYSIEILNTISNQQELQSLTNLCIANLGDDSVEAQSAKHGIFAHHNNIPHGIRIAVEYAMRNNYIHLVVCTSTLAQGINLPIRYLIVTSFYQGKELIKIRDFHNLIGRAGRAGKHVEGSILFSDTNIYDTKANEKWRWENAQKMLNPNKSEKCISSLLAIFEPIENDAKDKVISFGENTDDFERVVNKYIDNQLSDFSLEISQEFEKEGFSFKCVDSQLNYKRQLLESLENFLLAHWSDIEQNTENAVADLAKKTLAYHLANKNMKEQLKRLFQILAKNIANKIPDEQKKHIFGKTLYGVYLAQKIEAWVITNNERLFSITSIVDFIDVIWPLFCEVIDTSSSNSALFNKFDPKEIRKNILIAWVEGKSFAELLMMIKIARVNKINGTVRREFTVGDMVNLCEHTFAYEGTLIIGAIFEFMVSLDGFSQQIRKQIQAYQKCIKYGLPTISAVTIYELGFADRTIAQNIAESFPNEDCNRAAALDLLRKNADENNYLISQYPSYFQYVFSNLTQ